MTFCRSIYVKKIMKLFAFIFEKPSYQDRKKNTLVHKGLQCKARYQLIRVTISITCTSLRLEVGLAFFYEYVFVWYLFLLVP